MVKVNFDKLLKYKYLIILISIISLFIFCLLNKKKENFFISNNIHKNINTDKKFLEFTNYFNKCYIINLKNTKIGKKRWSIISTKYPFNKIGNKFNGIYGKE